MTSHQIISHQASRHHPSQISHHPSSKPLNHHALPRTKSLIFLYRTTIHIQIIHLSHSLTPQPSCHVSTRPSSFIVTYKNHHPYKYKSYISHIHSLLNLVATCQHARHLSHPFTNHTSLTQPLSPQVLSRQHAHTHPPFHGYSFHTPPTTYRNRQPSLSKPARITWLALTAAGAYLCWLELTAAGAYRKCPPSRSALRIIFTNSAALMGFSITPSAPASMKLVGSSSPVTPKMGFR